MKKANTRILRFPLDPTQREQIVEVPKGAELIDAGPDGMRSGHPSLWFACDPIQTATEQQVIAIIPTGENTPDPTQCTFLMRHATVCKSQSNPGQMSLRTGFYYQLAGKPRTEALERIAAVAALAD